MGEGVQPGLLTDKQLNAGDTLPPGWRRHARRAHLALIGRWVGTPRGRWLKTDLFEEVSPVRALLPLPGEWVGIDASLPVVQRVQLPIETLIADVRRLPFPDSSFDGVLSTSTLDHFDHEGDIHVALSELRRVLRPGGELILTLDNPDNPLVRIRNALPRRLQRASGLVNFYLGPTLSDQDGARALKRSGFHVLEVAYLLHAPHVIGTRMALFAWYERLALPFFDRLASTRLARRTGHFVAFHAIAR